MADISNVDAAVIKDLYERLENLPCETIPLPFNISPVSTVDSNHVACSPDYDPNPVLDELGVFTVINFTQCLTTLDLFNEVLGMMASCTYAREI